MGKLTVWLSRGHAARTGIGSSRFRTLASAGISVALLAILTAVFYAAPAVLPAPTNAQLPPPAVAAISKNMCLGRPSDYTDPKTCPLAPEVPVGQDVFYLIKVANPVGQPTQNITLTDTYPTGFVQSQQSPIYCTDQNNQPVTLNPASNALGWFVLQPGAIVTCFVLGQFDPNVSGSLGQNHTNTATATNETTSYTSNAVTTNVLQNTPLNTDLEVTKTVLPTSIDISGGGVVPADYTIVIKNVGSTAVDVGQWFVLHDNLSLLPYSVPVRAQLVPGSFSCTSSNPSNTDCLAISGPTIAVSGQTLIPTMAPKHMFDWGFAGTGRIAIGETITVKFRVEFQKLADLKCVKSVAPNMVRGVKNTVFFTLTNPNGTAASDINNANNTGSADLEVITATGTPPVDPSCGDGQLKVTKVQRSPTGLNSGMTASSPLPWGTPVVYDITITNVSIPNQSITINGGDLEDYVVEGLGTPPFTRTYLGNPSLTCVASNVSGLCTAFNGGAGGGGVPPPLPGLPPTSFKYSYYGQAALSWKNRGPIPPPNKQITLPGNPANQYVTIRVAFTYSKPDCETVPIVKERPVDNVAVVKYMATALGASSTTPQDVQYTQTATARTYMAQQKACQFEVRKWLKSGAPLRFGTPLVYGVTFTNNEPGRTIGTVIDAVRITDASYATLLPFTSNWSCSQVGGVSGYAPTGSITNGGAIYTKSPSQGAPAANLRQNPSVPIYFAQGATLSCTITIWVKRPAYNNPHCTADPVNLENLGLMDVTHPFNSNVPWPVSGAYVASQPSNPTPSTPLVNWASVQAPLPKCYNAIINKQATVVNGLSPAWTWAGSGGPPVDYTITVTNTASSGPLTGSYSGLNWLGLFVVDSVVNPYPPNVVARSPLCGPPPGTSPWCKSTSPFGASLQFNPPIIVGVASLGSQSSGNASGNWLLRVNGPFSNAPPPGIPVIRNCTRVVPTKELVVGGGAYTNFDPSLAPPPPNNPQHVCVDVPILPTTSITITKQFNDLTGAGVQGLSFDLGVSCKSYPLLGGSTTTVTTGANGTATWTVNNVPVAQGENCKVTETQPPVPAAATRACDRKGGIAVWDPPSYSPAQPIVISASAQDNAVKVTNTLRCVQRVDVSIEKTADPHIAGVGDYVAFNIAVTNNGASAITTPASIVVTDTLPVGLTYYAYSPQPQWSCVTPGPPIVCTYVGPPMPLAPSATTPTLQIIAKAEKEGTYQNCSTVKVDNALQVQNGKTESCAEVAVTPKEDCCCDTFLNGCFIDLSFLGDGYGCMTLAQMLWFMTITLLTAILWVAWCVCRLVKGMRQ